MIYADPPWRYSQKGLQGAAEKHDPTMSIEELSALLVAELAAPDSVVFLWATFPQLPEALRLIRAWGFTYKSVALLWPKKNRKADSWDVWGNEAEPTMGLCQQHQSVSNFKSNLKRPRLPTTRVRLFSLL